MVRDVCDFHCFVCGKYLFTEGEIPDETDPCSPFGKVIWKIIRKTALMLENWMHLFAMSV